MSDEVYETPPRVNVLGVGISVLNLPLAVEKVFEGSERTGFNGYVTVSGVHGVMESQDDIELKRMHNQSYLSTPDGMPMVWMGRWDGFEEMSRVYGPDLMLDVFCRGEQSGHRHFLFGAADGVAQKLAENLKGKFPATEIVGVVTPPFRPLTEEEEEDLVAELREKKPHFFWVGLSTPKQERFMHGFLNKYPDLTKGWDHGMIMLGVGAAFDFHAGMLRQAPGIMQRCGMEWFFRLCMEPRRLWRRYFFNNTRFVLKILPQRMGFRNYPLEK